MVMTGVTQFIAASTTDQHGQYEFGNLSSGSYVMPIILWESPDRSSPCPMGSRGPQIGGWMNTASAETGVQTIFVLGLTRADKSGVERRFSEAREKGVPFLGMAVVPGDELMVASGETVKHDVRVECQ
jgi:hypothetical protein